MIPLRKLWLVVTGFFTDKEPVPPPVPDKPIKKTPSQEKDLGDFYFKGAILDQLDSYFRILKTMKAADREGYAFFSRWGGVVIPEPALDRLMLDFPNQELSPWWKSNKPSIGGVFVGARRDGGVDTGEFLHPRALYFVKFDANKAPPALQRSAPGTDVYKITVYWAEKDDKRGKDRGSPTEFGVSIDPDNNITVLKTKMDMVQSVQGQNGHRFGIPQKKWGFDSFFVNWAAEHDIPMDEYLKKVFLIAANSYEAAQSGVARVRVRRGSVCGVFSLNILRTPYFFKDRDAVTNENGQKKKIFHIVRAHKRELSDGSVSWVKTHFRGLKTFMWNRYDVEVSVPGWHYLDTAEFDGHAVDVDADERNMVSLGGVGDIFSEIESLK